MTALFWMNSKAEPWKAFDPDLRVTLVTAPVARPSSASKLLVEMSTVWMASAGGMMIWKAGALVVVDAFDLVEIAMAGKAVGLGLQRALRR